MNSRINFKRIFILTDEQEIEDMGDGYWDDNGGETDGGLYIVPADDLALDEARVIHGYEITGYTGQYAQVHDHDDKFCGWSSRRVAYTADLDIAEAIAAEEDIAENEA